MDCGGSRKSCPNEKISGSFSSLQLYQIHIFVYKLSILMDFKWFVQFPMELHYVILGLSWKNGILNRTI
jgi:hypothetical protein